jgi:hypothetical protein
VQTQYDAHGIDAVVIATFTGHRTICLLIAVFFIAAVHADVADNADNNTNDG